MRTKEIRAAVDNGMAWTVRHLDHFDPFHGGQEFHVRTGQRVTELATMALTYALRHPEPDRAALAAILDRLTAIQANPRFAQRVLRAPAEFALYCDTYGVLRRLDRAEPSHHALLQRAIDAGILDQVERVPHRRMDVRLSLGYAGLRHDWPTMADLASSSLAAGPLRAAYLDDASVYALTHVVMFASAFGTAYPPELGAATVDPVVLDHLICAAAQDHHWDLLAELLLAVDSLRLPDTATVHKGWSALLARVRPDGAVPGPESALAGMGLDRDIEPDDSLAGYVAHHYHTTLVTVIAGCVRLARSSEPAPDSAVTAQHPEAAEVDGAVRSGLDWLLRLGGLRTSTASASESGAQPIADLGAVLDELDLSDRSASGRLATAVAGSPPIDADVRAAATNLAAGLGMAAARRYDLVSTARMLHSLGQLGADPAIRAPLVRFLLEQQDADGAFGFFALEAAGMRSTLGPDFDPDRQLRAPVTIACARALAAAQPA